MMANPPPPNDGGFVECTPQEWISSPSIPRTSTEPNERMLESSDFVQGRIFWLGSKDELPERAVKRAHGKGAIDEGIYSHPVVVLARPADEAHLVHFHLITSLQGKKLDQLYNKSTEFHASRRSWYLPISPTPDHPDATSKKTKKRFPTLDLTDGAILRWDSYVNIRHVYKIDWSLLKPYSNPDTSETHMYQFDRESTVRLLAKSKFLTMYEPGPQCQNNQTLKRSATVPARMPSRITENIQEGSLESRSTSLDGINVVAQSSTPSRTWKTFKNLDVEDRIAEMPPKVPPDRSPKAAPIVLELELRQVLSLSGEMSQQMVVRSERERPIGLYRRSPELRSGNRFWQDMKDYLALAIPQDGVLNVAVQSSAW